MQRQIIINKQMQAMFELIKVLFLKIQPVFVPLFVEKKQAYPRCVLTVPFCLSKVLIF